MSWHATNWKNVIEEQMAQFANRRELVSLMPRSYSQIQGTVFSYYRTDKAPSYDSTSNKQMGTESVGTSIAARSGLSVTSDVTKILPDPLKVAKDIRDQLKSTYVSHALKNKIVTATKEVEILINCYKTLGPYFRRPLVELRQAVKKKAKHFEEMVEDQYQLFTEKLEKIKSKKNRILEAAEAKKVAVPKKRTIFQVLIDDNIRICSVDEVMDLSNWISEAKKFKKRIQELEEIGNKDNFPPELSEELKELSTMLNSAMALDGITAMRSRHEVVQLRNLVVTGPEAEDEIKLRMKILKSHISSTIVQCEDRRDKKENYVNDVTKLMLNMDKEINEKNLLLKSHK